MKTLYKQIGLYILLCLSGFGFSVHAAEPYRNTLEKDEI